MPRQLLAFLACLACTHSSRALNTVATTPTPPPQTVSTAQPTGRITGTVYCSDTHKPARGADVHTSHTTEAAAITDADGHYSFNHLKPGLYHVRAFLPGYVTEDVPLPAPTPDPNGAIPSSNVWVNVPASGDAVLDITLNRGAALSGRVYFSDGTPAISADMTIEVARPPTKDHPDKSFAAFREQFFRHGSAKTDDHGNFRLVGLPAGTYRLSVTPLLQMEDSESYFRLPDDSPEDKAPASSSLTVYAGNTLDRSSAKTFTVRPGDELTGIEISIPLAAVRRVQGTVTAANGLSINSGMVTLADTTDTTVRYRTAIRLDGSFLFTAVPPGTYKLTIFHAYHAISDDPTREDLIDTPTNAFANVTSTIVLKDSDLLDLHFDLTEIPLPPKLTDDDN